MAVVTTKQAVKQLVDLGACGEARRWVAKQESAQAAWGKCRRPLWMHWLIVREASTYLYDVAESKIRRDVLALARRHVKHEELLALVNRCLAGQIGHSETLDLSSTFETTLEKRVCYICLTSNVCGLISASMQMRGVNGRLVIGITGTCDLIRKYFPTWPERSV